MEPGPSKGAHIICVSSTPDSRRKQMQISLKKNIPKVDRAPGFSQTELTIKNYQACKGTSSCERKSAGTINNRLRRSRVSGSDVPTNVQQLNLWMIWNQQDARTGRKHTITQHYIIFHRMDIIDINNTENDKR